MTDNFKHKGLRKQLIEEIKSKGITDAAVLKAIETVPRHLFMDDAFLDFAYKDSAFQIGAGQTISQPYTVAYQTELLKINKGDKILEIGTGSGYQTAILMELGAKVFSIERQKSLFDKAKVLLPKLGYNPKLYYGDGYKGLPNYAPFDKILVTAGAPIIPEALKEQLKVGGILVIPLGKGRVQIMTTLTKLDNENFETKSLKEFSFVPLLEDKEW
jgi:protein-L-isoaspartate(D-aspartate) O-methyltransferase